MAIGISTSCFYPMQTEKALKELADLKIDVCEVFFNARSEIEDAFLDELKMIKSETNLKVSAVHPFFSFAEPYLIFSEYERRFEDSLLFYDRYFEAAKKLGAEILVIHGPKRYGNLPDEFFYEKFAILAQRGKAAGIKVAQENVVNYMSASPDYLMGLKRYMGEDFCMVLDLKQSVRSGISAFEFVERLGSSIIHVHISDYNDKYDCMLPGKGIFDFSAFFDAMIKLDYKGDYIIELYRQNFKQKAELIDSLQIIKTIYEAVDLGKL